MTLSWYLEVYFKKIYQCICKIFVCNYLLLVVQHKGIYK
jgi:hypothetical protein